MTYHKIEASSPERGVAGEVGSKEEFRGAYGKISAGGDNNNSG